MRTSRLAAALLFASFVFFATAATAAPASDDSALAARIEALRVSFVFEEAEFVDVIEHVRRVTGLNVAVDPRVERELHPELRKVSVKLEQVPFRSVVKLIFETRGLAIDVADGALYVLPRRVKQAQLSLKLHDVRDLLARVQDFSGPEVAIDYAPRDWFSLG